MKKHDGWKKTVAFVLSLALVAGAMPANVGGFLTGSTGIVAKADTAIPANGTNGYIVGNVISCSAEAGRMEIHDGSADALFDNSNSKFCCCFSGEMTINFSYASSFVPKKYYIRTAGDTEDYSCRNMSQWRLQAKNDNGNWVDLDVKNGSFLPEANNEAVGFELNTTTAYKDYRLTGIRTFENYDPHSYWDDDLDDYVDYECIFQLSEIYFEEAVDSRTNLSDATVTLANKKAIVSVNGNIVPETEYDLKFGTTVANASDTYPTSAGKYYAFAIAKNGSKDYRGIATRSFAVISNSTGTRYRPYTINTTHGQGQRPSVFFEGDYIQGNSSDYLTIYLDGEQVLKDKEQRYTIPKICECVNDGYDESTFGHHEYIFYLESVPVPIWDASVTMQTGSPYVSSVVLNGKTLTLNKDYTITYKDADGQVINDLLAYSGYCTAVITGTNSYIDSVEGTFYLPSYGEPEWTWNADNTASAKFARTDGTDVQSKNATITSETTINPTCKNVGQIVYTAKVTFNNKEYTATKTVDISATGHTYGEPVWTWAEDYSTASAKFTCVNGDDVQTVNADITSKTTDATYTADGKIIYTAKATFNGTEYTDTKEVAINKLTLPHYDAVAPTCTKDGTLEYWYDEVNNKYFSDANGENELTNIIDSATGHKWKYSSKTNNADGSLTVIFACENDGCNETKGITITAAQILGIVNEAADYQNVTKTWIWGQNNSSATLTLNGITQTQALELATKLNIDQAIALYFAKNGITVPATVTTGETAPATCTQNGTKTLIAHVNQLTDTKIVDDNEQPATGHEYGSPMWSWSNNGNGYTATMKAVCSKCGEVKTYRANVTSTIADGMITYTATATVDGVNYTSTQQVKESYTLSVNGGTITDGAKESYSYADAVTVTADEQQGGKFFSGWYIGNTRITTKQSYTFYIKSDMTVTAKYEGETVQKEQADVSVMINRSNIADDKQKVVFSLNWALPSGCKLKEAGIVRRYDNADDLTLKNVDGSEIKKNASTLRTQNGNCNINLTVSATTKLKTINAVAYVVYTDKNGGEQTVYSNVQTSAYTN